MYIYVVRHAQSRGNVDDPENHPFPPILAEYEDEDPSLTQKGQEQADRLGRRLSQIDFDAILCGPLHRQISTARKVVKYQKNPKSIEIMTTLCETDTPGTPGLPPEILSSLYPELDLVFPKEKEVLESLDIENYNMAVRERAVRIERMLTERFQSDSRVLIVTSEMFTTYFLVPALMRLSKEVRLDIGFRTRNAGVSMVHMKDDGIHSCCAFQNDIAHLAVSDLDLIPKIPFPYEL